MMVAKDDQFLVVNEDGENCGYLGGTKLGGQIALVADGKQRFYLGAHQAVLNLGGNGRSAELSLYPASSHIGQVGVAPKPPSAELTGEGNIILGSDGSYRIKLDGSRANVWVGGHGQDGDIMVFRSGETETSDHTKASVRISGESGDIIFGNADCAEEFDLMAAEEGEAGAVMIMTGDAALAKCRAGYDKRVVGVVSGAGTFKPAIILDRQASASRRVPVAVLGKVFCKADAQYGRIETGDLLTTSPTVGHAMKAVDQLRSFGAVIGKALAPLSSGRGLVPVLIGLRGRAAAMANLSTREHFKRIGEPKSGNVLPAFPGGFHSTPRRLRSALRATASPQIESWSLVPVAQEFANRGWTEECQGLTTDGEFWYVSSNNDDFRAIHKLKLVDFSPVSVIPPFATFPKHLGSHIGSPDYHEGRIYAPLEPSLQVLIFDTSPTFIGAAALKPGTLTSLPQQQMPWCAVNPWNGLLYTSNFDNVTEVYAYDPNQDFSFVKSLTLRGGEINGVQAGVFSKNGHLYLASDKSKKILAFSAMNGHYLGSCKIPYEQGGLEQEELEGIAILPIDLLVIKAHIHVLVLDNDLNSDDVFLKHFVAPSPEDV
jgi:hypothetical protein